MAGTTSGSSSKGTSYEDLNEQIAILRDDISALTGTISEMTKLKAAELSDDAEKRVRAARQKGVDTAAIVASQARDVQSQANEFVEARPGTALGIAAGLGFLFGMMSSWK